MLIKNDFITDDNGFHTFVELLDLLDLTFCLDNLLMDSKKLDVYLR